MKRPAFQFYPADWLNDIKLQTCSLGAQGLLVSLMCLMHQSDRYGYLLINGINPPNKDVSHLLRLHHKTYQASLIELLLYGVLCKDENGVIFCKRMVEDERIREIRSIAGKLGGSPLLKQKVKQGFKQKTTPSTSSSTSSSKKEKYIKRNSEEKVFLSEGIKEVLGLLNKLRCELSGKDLKGFTSDKFIKNRLMQGHTVFELCRIIELKARHVEAGKHDILYYTPKTLFGDNHFDEYLGQADLERA